MAYEFSTAVDPGRQRANNEDCVTVSPSCGVLVLADGMGGYNAGEVASSMACEAVRDELVGWLTRAPDPPAMPDLRQAMEAAVEHANRQIFNAGSTQVQYSGMGTTLVAAVFLGAELVVGHVGDSRMYRFRAGRLEQITRDHSLLQEQVDAGLITPEQAAFSTHKNLVTRAVGVEDAVMLETHVHPVQPGDLYLACSDGLSDMLPDPQIALLLQQQAGGSLEQGCRALIDAANEAGGRDNIAVILARASGGASTTARNWWPFRR